MTVGAAPAPGLQRAGARLPIDEYSRRLWHRRWFVVAYATSANAVGYQRSFLGQAWQLLTPLLNILVYYLIFGLLLHTSRGVPNFIAYLSVGVIVFSFCTGSLISGARSITTNLGLVRALPFPRAVLPVSTTLVGLLQLFSSLLVLIPILVITGVPLSWRWLELLPALALQTLFCLGLALCVARAGAQIPDTTQILPFVSRVWTFGSGVMFSVTRVTASNPPWVGNVLKMNPGYVFLTLARHALLVGSPATAMNWIVGAAWGFGTLAVAYPYFWRGEETYGNV